FAPDGTRSTFASELDYPHGLAFDSAGNLFVAEYTSGTILKFAPDGTRSIFASGLIGPQGLAFDSAGNLFAADYNDGAIWKFAPDGTGSIFAYAQTPPTGLAFDSAGNLFVGETGPDGAIWKFAPDGTGSIFATFAPPGNDPYGLAFDSEGNLFVAVYTANTIYKFLPDGTQSTFATGLDGPFFLAIQPIVPQNAFSQKTHGGAGTFDIPLPLTGNVGIECRRGGATNDYQMIINFMTSVTVDSASVTFGTGSVSSFSVSGPQVTVNLTGVANVQRITVTIFDVNDG